MAHLTRDKEKIINRIRRLRGQVEAIERGLDEGRECADILMTIAACRGAIQSLMYEVLESHVREHVLEGERRGSQRSKAAEELVEAMRMFIR
jgi:DNA-binding FrmR family transcriptional regulator